MRSVSGLLLVFAVALLLLASQRAHADWINMTGAETAPNIAEFHIEDDRLLVRLEVFVGDLEVFHDLVPDDLLAQPDPDRDPLDERVRRFSSQMLRVLADDGELLSAELTLAEPRLRQDRASPFAGLVNPTTGRVAPKPPEDKRVLYVELAYPFSEKPRRLTIIPPLDDRGIPRASMGFVTYHNAVPVIDFRFLTDSATVILDWDDPWYSKFEAPRLTRHHKSGLMSFLYVEQNEVRHEVLARLKDLENWIDLDLEDKRYIAPEEWEKLKDRVVAFLETRNKVLIDGVAIQPIFDRANFVSVSLQGVRAFETPQRLESSTAMLGVIFAYLVERIPQEVTVDWDLFTDNIPRVPVVATDPAGPFPSFAEPEDPVIEWRNFLQDYRAPVMEPIHLQSERLLALPVLTLILVAVAVVAAALTLRPRILPRKAWVAVVLGALVGAGALSPIAIVTVENPLAGLPSRDVAARIVGELVGNLHNTLKLRDEEKRQRALATSVVEPKIAEVLPELRRALAIEIQGGGIARVDSIDQVDVRDIDKLPSGSGFRAQADWSADARASHWGHLHQRKIRFSALLDLVPTEKAWKLTGITVLSIKDES
jgi:hypothetical protein